MRLLIAGILLLIIPTAWAQDKFSTNKFIKSLKKEAYPKSHIQVYKTGDSIKNLLINRGVDTIMLYYKTQKYFRRNNDHTIDKHLCILFWKENNVPYWQRINEYSIYKQKLYKVKDLPFIFQFYLNNARSIDNERLQSIPFHVIEKKFRDSTHTTTYSKVEFYETSQRDNSLSIIDYKIGIKERWLFWSDLDYQSYRDLESGWKHPYFEDHFYEDLDKKIFTWVLLIEREYQKLLFEPHEPLNMKFMTNAEFEAYKKRVRSFIKRDPTTLSK